MSTVLPASLRRVLASRRPKAAPAPAVERTTTLRDGQVYREFPNGSVRQLPPALPLK